MNAHPRAKLGLAARQELCNAIAAGMSIRAAARRFNVSAATAHKWRHRWLAASIAERRSLACLRDRSSRPRTNDKVERFHQTMARKWAYGMAYRSHRHRNKALPRWLRHYNEARPHSGIGNRPPISRVYDLSGQDN